MDAYMPRSTNLRHNEIITNLIGRIFNIIEQKDIRVFHEEGALVYYGEKKEPEILKLVNVDRLNNKEHFRENVMNELYCVQPDFMLFMQNNYIENKRRTRMAGCPDLIIEIWFDGNEDDEKAFKKYLYSTAEKTEHWYIEQDSNEVICFFGENPLPAQSLTDVLKTTNGIEFDLRRMAIQEIQE